MKVSRPPRSSVLCYALIALMIVDSSSRYLQQASISAEILSPPILPGNQDLNYYLSSYSSEAAQVAGLNKDFQLFVKSSVNLSPAQISDVTTGFMTAEGNIQSKYQATLLQRESDTDLNSTDVATATDSQKNIAASLLMLQNKITAVINRFAASGPNPVTSVN